MITQIRIENFQSHEKTVLKFVEGVNVIVGTSDKGKSSIMRAINWILTNRPVGDAFRSWWGGDTYAAIETDFETGVTRKKTDKINEYTINTPDGILELKAVGVGLPVEVEKALQIKPINFQSQFDPPFLLSISPGDVAVYLNKIVNLEEIDTSMSFINKGIKNLDVSIKRDEQAIEKANEQIAQYAHLDTVDAQVLNLEQKQTVLENTSEDRAQLIELTDTIYGIENTHANIAQKIKHATTISSIEQQNDTLTRRNAEFERICALADDIKELNTVARDSKQRMRYANKVDALMSVMLRKEKLEKSIHDLDSLTDAVFSLRAQVDLCEMEIQQLEAQLKELTPDTCPLCGRSDVDCSHTARQ